MKTSTSSFLRSILGFALLICTALSLQAASLPTSLQGSYKAKTTTLTIAGNNMGAHLSKLTLPIGSRGLKVITPYRVKALLKASGLGSGLTVTITESTLTTFAFTAEGSFNVSDYNIVLNSGSGTASLSKSGLRVKLTFDAVVNGILPVSGTETLVLKK